MDDRQALLIGLADNCTEMEEKMLKAGYVPMNWLLGDMLPPLKGVGFLFHRANFKGKNKLPKESWGPVCKRCGEYYGKRGRCSRAKGRKKYCDGG